MGTLRCKQCGNSWQGWPEHSCCSECGYNPNCSCSDCTAMSEQLDARLVLRNSTGGEQIRVTLDSPNHLIMQWGSTQFKHHFSGSGLVEVARWARALTAALEEK